MTTLKATPGPWKIDDEFYNEYDSNYRIGGENWSAFAEVVVRTTDGGVIKNAKLKDEGVANAHLIASAPDMYAMLYELSQCNAEEILDNYDLWERVDKALAKARGED